MAGKIGVRESELMNKGNKVPAFNVKRRSHNPRHGGEAITWRGMGEAVSLLKSSDTYMWTYCIHAGRQAERG